jgi:hypothetical protein
MWVCWRSKALRLSAASKPFARSGSQRGSWLNVAIASNPGWRCGGQRRVGARAFESRPLHRCVQAGSRVTRSVCGASTGATCGSGHGHARLTVGWSKPPAHGESRIIAVRVRSWSSGGVPRIPFWLQKSSSSVWPREATAVAAVAGDGGLAQPGDWRWRTTLMGPGAGDGPWVLGSRRATRWRKTSRAVAAVVLHGAAGKAVLAVRAGGNRSPLGW